MKLWQYILRRLFLLVPVLFGITLVTFALAYYATGGHLENQYLSNADRITEEKVEAIRKQYGFDRPAYLQYFSYLTNLLKGDMGLSTSVNRPVTEVISTNFPATAELAIAAMLLAILVGIPLGILSATKRDKLPDHVTRFVALSGVSVPVFWLALILQLFLSYHLGRMGFDFFPLNGRADPLLYFDHPVLNPDRESACALAASLGQTCLPQTGFLLLDTLVWRDFEAFWNVLRHMLLPSITLAFIYVAVIARMMRASMLEVLSLDYIRTARAKGLDERMVINRHARRNALIPTTTVIGLAIGGLMGGAVLTETIFSWPGIGRWAALSILSIDTAAIMGVVVLSALIYVVSNLVVDIVYAYLDPRVRLE